MSGFPLYRRGLMARQKHGPIPEIVPIRARCNRIETRLGFRLLSLGLEPPVRALRVLRATFHTLKRP